MKLQDLSRVELEATARKLAIKVAPKMTDVALRNAIRAARKAGSNAEAEKGKRGGAVWPADWPAEMRAVYYEQIVGKPMPDDVDAAYRHLLKVIDAKVPDATPGQHPDGAPDCYALYFNTAHTTCMTICPHMPLCKSVCERRPELAHLAEHVSDAIDEASKLSDAEKAEGAKLAHGGKTLKVSKAGGRAKPAPKAKPAAPTKEDRFMTTAKFASAMAKLDDDRSMRTVYRWMQKAKTFSAAELAEQFAKFYPDDADITPATIAWLRSEKAIATAR